MYAQLDPQDPPSEHVLMPLKGTLVSGDIDGYLSAVNVRQTFANDFDVKIEAVYVFPLPQDAAVHDFVMTIGERTIRGVIRPREEAERIYDRARAAGHRASLMTQERPNIFTQKVANIAPGGSIDVDITYYHALPYRDDAFVFTFPMTVGPRYNPAVSADPVVASPRGSGDVGRGTTVEYLEPGEFTDHAVGLELDIEAGVPITRIESPSHAIEVDRRGSTSAGVRLAANDRVPNRDFVLRIGVAKDDVGAAFLHTPDDDGEGGVFSVMLVPPSERYARAEGRSRLPVELILLLDASGSMEGHHIGLSKAAARRALRSLQPGDTFNVVRFASGVATFRDGPVLASRANVRAGLRYVDLIEAGGGTEALSGIRAALDTERDAERRRVVVFMTDGLIGNEIEVLAATREHLHGARVFGFGVGSAPNRHLLERIARLGRGAVAFLSAGDSASVVMDAFFDRVAVPVMTDVRLSAGDVRIDGMYPTRNIELLRGRPLIVSGRYFGDLPREVTVSGVIGGEEVSMVVPTQRRGDVSPHPALPTLYARTRIAELTDALAFTGDRRFRDRIESLALAHNLMSAYTAFLAVDTLETTPGEFGVSVVQPVRVPEGTRYETTVGPSTR